MASDLNEVQMISDLNDEVQMASDLNDDDLSEEESIFKQFECPANDVIPTKSDYQKVFKPSEKLFNKEEQKLWRRQHEVLKIMYPAKYLKIKDNYFCCGKCDDIDDDYYGCLHVMGAKRISASD